MIENKNFLNGRIEVICGSAKSNDISKHPHIFLIEVMSLLFLVCVYNVLIDKIINVIASICLI